MLYLAYALEIENKGETMTERTKPYTTRELAKEAGVNPSRIRQLLIAGEMTGDKVGRDWLISPEEAQRFLEGRRARWEKF